jgi:hypothetical protein
MRCLTPAECAEWCRRHGYPLATEETNGRAVPDVRRQFMEIRLTSFGDMGELVARARQVLDWMSGSGDLLLWLHHWSVWSSTQHMPLFTRLRESVGEHRSLAEAPGQLITQAQIDDGISVLAIALWFLWDCTIFSERRGPVFFCSFDDEWNRFFIPPDYDRTPLIAHFRPLIANPAAKAAR